MNSSICGVGLTAVKVVLLILMVPPLLWLSMLVEAVPVCVASDPPPEYSWLKATIEACPFVPLVGVHVKKLGDNVPPAVIFPAAPPVRR